MSIMNSSATATDKTFWIYEDLLKWIMHRCRRISAQTVWVGDDMNFSYIVIILATLLVSSVVSLLPSRASFQPRMKSRLEMNVAGTRLLVTWFTRAKELHQ